MAAATVQSSSSGLTRSQSSLIAGNWSEVIRYLAPPGVAWHWSECGVSHRVKYNWKEDGLIKRSPGGERWETTMRLWMHVIEKASDDETVGGKAVGQQTLADAPRDPARPTRVLGDETRRTRPRSQATLAGDVIDAGELVSDEDRAAHVAARTSAKDATRHEDAKTVATRHPAQTRLAAWRARDEIDLDQWTVSASHCGLRLTMTSQVHGHPDTDGTVHSIPSTVLDES